jgi:hypothetical protein
MNFEDAVRHITRRERLNKHVKGKECGALEWIQRYIEAIPTKYSADKKFLKQWLANKNDLPEDVADFYRGFFAEWKKEEKSRSARLSSLCAKPRQKPTDEKAV